MVERLGLGILDCGVPLWIVIKREQSNQTTTTQCAICSVTGNLISARSFCAAHTNHGTVQSTGHENRFWLAIQLQLLLSSLSQAEYGESQAS